MKQLFLLTLIWAMECSALAHHVDTDGDGLLDLIDVHGFDPDARGEESFIVRGIQDLDGANQLIDLQELSLTRNRITSIESGDFAGLTNLQELFLNLNQITNIQSGAFEGLTNVQSLNLEKNEITTVGRGGFQGLDNLRELDLDDNHIVGIESGDFEGLTNLKELSLRDNQIKSIESSGFQHLTTLKSLSLSRNQLRAIESGHFEGLSNLQELRLGGNQLTTIQSGVFEGLTNLQFLAMGNNALTSIESGGFQGLTNLRTLRVPLTNFKAGAFDGLPNLQSLYLYGHDHDELNFTRAEFQRLGSCAGPLTQAPYSTEGLCHSYAIEGRTLYMERLILDDALLSLDSFRAIIGETDFPDISLVGLRFSDANPESLNDLLRVSSLDNVTVDQTLFDFYADEFNTFAAMEGNTVTVVPSSPAEDFNNDGWVDFTDFIDFSNVFNLPATGGNAVFDLDGSGTVDFGDFVPFSNAFGTHVEAATVPEPASVTLLLSVFFLIVSRRRHSGRPFV